MRKIMVVFYILCCFSVYLLPAGIAGLRNHKDTGAIFMLNLLLGWSIIAWIISLVWSLKNE